MLNRRGRFILILAGAVLLMCGCRQALFPADSPRTQFQTHQQLRGGYVPLTEPDVFGTPQPALRARLSQN